jgi:hypothetical protein
MKPRKTLRAVKHAGNDKIIKREPRLQPENSATPSSATLSTDKAKAQAAGLKAKVRLLAGWVMLVSMTCTLFCSCGAWSRYERTAANAFTSYCATAGQPLRQGDGRP